MHQTWISTVLCHTSVWNEHNIWAARWRSKQSFADKNWIILSIKVWCKWTRSDQIRACLPLPELLFPLDTLHCKALTKGVNLARPMRGITKLSFYIRLLWTLSLKFECAQRQQVYPLSSSKQAFKEMEAFVSTGTCHAQAKPPITNQHCLSWARRVQKKKKSWEFYFVWKCYTLIFTPNGDSFNWIANDSQRKSMAGFELALVL